MDTDRDRRVAGLVLFMMGGLAGTALALKWARRGESESMGSTLQGLHGVLDETVDSVESTIGYLRRIVSPLHEILEEASGLAIGFQRAVDSYRQISRRGNGENDYVPSMASEIPRPGGAPGH